MVYALRKRKAEEMSGPARARAPLHKRPRYRIEKMKTLTPARETSARPSSLRRRRTPRQRYAQQIRETAANRPAPEVQSNFQEIAGSEVKSISDLKSAENYLKLKVGTDSNVEFVLRKVQSLNANSLRMQETEYSLRLFVPNEGVKRLTLQGFMGSLWDTFEMLFNHFAKIYPGQEICFHATHDELDGSLSSSIFELTDENRDTCIAEVLSRINAWNESSRIGAAIRDIRLSATILNRNLPGNGILLAVGDTALRQKAFSLQNFTGSILYVESLSNCFFISIYFCLIYNIYSVRFKDATTSEERKRLQRLLANVYETKGEALER